MTLWSNEIEKRGQGTRENNKVRRAKRNGGAARSEVRTEKIRKTCVANTESFLGAQVNGTGFQSGVQEEKGISRAGCKKEEDSAESFGKARPIIRGQDMHLITGIAGARRTLLSCKSSVSEAVEL
jgi:hypothetical protein